MSVSASKKCCVSSCGKSRPEVILHNFPHPDNDKERFHTWLLAVGGDVLSLDNKVVHKYRRVCHLHFSSKYYTRSNRLSANAVPTKHVLEAESSSASTPRVSPVAVVPSERTITEEDPLGSSSDSEPCSSPISPHFDIVNELQPFKKRPLTSLDCNVDSPSPSIYVIDVISENEPKRRKFTKADLNPDELKLYEHLRNGDATDSIEDSVKREA